MPQTNPKFPGRVEVPPEPVSPSEDGYVYDLRMFINGLAKLGARVDPGYAEVRESGRTVTASRFGVPAGWFHQFQEGTYAHNGLPRYVSRGIGEVYDL